MVACKIVLVAGVIPLPRDYRYIRENPERRFQHARCAKPSRRVRKDFRAALAANSEYSDHCPRLGVCSHLVLRKILSKITPALKTRISPIYTKALTVSVLVDDFVVALSQLAMNLHAKTHELKNLFFVKQLRQKWIEARISRIH